MPRIAFVHTSIAYYRVKTYEILASRLPDLKFYFYWQGKKWYSLPGLTTHSDDFAHEYVRSVKIGRHHIPLGLIRKLWPYDIYISAINGRFALPITFCIARLRRKPFILWTGIWHRVDTPFHKLFFPFIRYIYRHADAIVTYGPHIDEYLVGEGVERKRLFTTKHAVENADYWREVAEEEKAALRQKLNLNSDQKICLYVGRIVHEKGLNYLVDAFAQLKREDVTLVMVGSGNEEEPLKAYIKEKHPHIDVRFVGYVAPTDTVKYYAIADVLVLPSITTSRFKEPWGLVVNEGLNQRVPVIATEAVGAAAGGLVQHDFNGYIVPERDSASLFHYLQSLLDDDAKRKQLGENGRDRVLEWSNESMVETFLEAINAVQNE